MLGVFAAAFLAALTTMFLTPFVRDWAMRKGVVDIPNARRINKEPMPRAGGVAIFVGFMLAAVVAIAIRQWRDPATHTWTLQVTGVLVATSIMAIMGLVDDLKNLSPRWQIVAMAVSGVVLVAFGVRIEGLGNALLMGQNASLASRWIPLSMGASIAITVFWVIVVTKTVDMIDGVDGLAAGVATIAATTLALMATQLRTIEGATLGLLAAALAGACLGFLRHNYHPARIIMGTIGAQTLGFVLAAISIMGAFKLAAAVSVAVPVLVLGVPIFDFTHVIARRILERAPITQADKRHLHHRLLARGWNQKQVVWAIYGITFLCCAAALVIFQAGRFGR